MTRKDYQLIADAMKAVRPDVQQHERRDQWLQSIGSLATGLKRDNPRFNRDKFIAACEA